MRKPILCLTLALIVALVAFIGVPEPMKGVAEVGLFALLVVFVVLMISHLVEDG
jgi:uncharacterized membrane protein YtjA (UPF0391 family)